MWKNYYLEQTFYLVLLAVIILVEKQFNKKWEFYAICDERPKKCFVVSSENVMILTVPRELMMRVTHGLIESEIESCQIAFW